jgi:hypothetical protein
LWGSGTISKGRKNIIVLEDSQALPARSYDKGGMKVKTVRVISTENLMTETAEFYFPVIEC